MTLIKCKECGREVASTAKSCPNCGAAVRASRLSLGQIGCLSLIGLVVLGYLVGGGEERARSASTAVAPAPLPPVDSTLSFRSIRNQMRDEMTEAQFKALARALESRRVRWRGWVEDVNEKMLGGYELWVDMDSPAESMSVQDVTFDIPQDLALALRKDSRVVFEGTIASIQNIMGSLQIRLKDARILR